MTNKDESAFQSGERRDPVIGVSGVPVDHFAIDMTKPAPAEARESEASECPRAEAPKAKETVTVPPASEPAKVTEEITVTVPSVEIIGIRFKKNGKIYYFDPRGMKGQKGQFAIVETSRGQEYGEIALENTRVPETEIVPPIRPMLRIATEADMRHFEENRRKEEEAFSICLAKIEAHKLDMKLVEAQYTFDNSKLLFYFTSAGRVDFRELVKDLASVFRTRIELRQIGIRDEAKLIGGLGSCGRSLCCSGFLTDFGQVSIKMAKEQNLSLNSTKISGTCGRLMCCLRYEYETYLEEIRLTPPVDSKVKTPDGLGTIVEILPMMTSVKVRLASDPDSPPKVYHRDLVAVCDGTDTPQKAESENIEERFPPILEGSLSRDVTSRRSFPNGNRTQRDGQEEPPALRRKEDGRDGRRHPSRNGGKRSGEGDRPVRTEGPRRDLEDERLRTQQGRPHNAPPKKRPNNKTQHRGGKGGSGNS